jgi:putative restriction endonuclease
MLRHGLQDMHDRKIRLPQNPKARPSRDRLAERFAQFALK